MSSEHAGHEAGVLRRGAGALRSNDVYSCDTSSRDRNGLHMIMASDVSGAMGNAFAVGVSHQ